MGLVNSLLTHSAQFVRNENGLSYPTLRILNGCLEEVLQNLQNPQTEAGEETVLNLNEQWLQEQVTLLAKAVELENCGNNKYELELRVKGQFSSVRDHVDSQIDSLVSSKTAAGIKNALTAIFHTLSKEGYLEKKAYQFMKLVNEAFESGDETLREIENKRIAEEAKVQKNLETILSHAIHREITTFLDSTLDSNNVSFLSQFSLFNQGKELISKQILEQVSAKVKKSIHLMSQEFYVRGTVNQALYHFLQG